jgi:hypothetical protein
MERSENKESEGRRWPAEQMETPQPRPAPFERAVDSPRRRHIPAAHGEKTNHSHATMDDIPVNGDFTGTYGVAIPASRLCFITKRQSVKPLLPACLKFRPKIASFRASFILSHIHSPSCGRSAAATFDFDRTADKHPLVLFPSDSLSAIYTRIFGSLKCSHSPILTSYISDLLLLWVHRLQGNTYGYQCYIKLSPVHQTPAQNRYYCLSRRPSIPSLCTPGLYNMLFLSQQWIHWVMANFILTVQ